MSTVLPRPAFAFTALLLIHDPLIALTRNAMFAHLLLLLAMAWFSLSLLYSFIETGTLVWVGGRVALLALMPLSALGLLYSMLDSGDIIVRLQFMATFLLLPFMWAAFSRLLASRDGPRVLNRLILVYVAFELVLMLLQAMYFLVGIGIPPGETYDSMISGSQFNSNNLACIVVVLSMFYNSTAYYASRSERLLFNVIVVLILLVLFSRLAVLLYIADRIRSLNLRRLGSVLAMSLVLGGIAAAFAGMDYTGNETIDATLYKGKSLAAIATLGLDADTSTSSRGESYRNFLEQLSTLGIGSVKILDYYRFTSSATFNDETLYVNPHSMLIEFGYWMGWPGLVTLTLFLILTYAHPAQGVWLQRAFILAAILLASSIPSSAIPLPPFWMAMLLLGMRGHVRPRTRSITARSVS